MFQATHTANPVRVNAAIILEVTDITDRSDGRGQSSPNLMLRLEDGRNFETDSSMTSRYVPAVGDYLVTQEDGYEYLNPKDVFERKYSSIEVLAKGDSTSRITGTSQSDVAIEQEIVAKGLTAPRVTPADIEANIASEHYFTADDGAQGAFNRVDGNFGGIPTPLSLNLLTFCVLVLRNGFTVTGESACASPENFDTEIGRKIARQNAVNKIWPLMGYALKQQLHDAAQ